MTEHGRFIPSHLPFPELRKCPFLYYTLKPSEFLWRSPHQVLRCAVHSQSRAAYQCKMTVTFEESKTQLVRPWHSLFLLLRICCAVERLSSLDREKKQATSARDLQADVCLAGPPSICGAALPGSWAAFRRVTAVIRAPTWFSACLHHPWHSLVLPVNTL